MTMWNGDEKLSSYTLGNAAYWALWIKYAL